MTHFFAVMLWVAAALAWVAGMPQLGAAICVVVVVNGVFAFVQQERAEHAAARLRQLLPRGVRVRRDGRLVTVPATAVVPGDVVSLGAGDRVPADATLTEAHGLHVDESMLTGESVPVALGVGDTVRAGTFVVTGDGEALVERTGTTTRLAEITSATIGVRRRASPLAVELHRIVRVVAVAALGAGLGFFVLASLVGTPARDGFLFAVGVTVALVPEGLLPTVTLSLAMGAQRMSARDALVRHLEAVETLGSTTYVCTDKTGTITCNEMSVVEVWTPRGSTELVGAGYEPTGAVVPGGDLVAAREAVAVARAASQGRAVLHDGRWVPDGDPMEAAIDAAHRRMAVNGSGSEPPVRDRRPFDPERRRESAVRGDRLLVKGAPDSVLPRCSQHVEGAEEALHALTGRGLRVLAVADRAVAGVPPDASADEAESDLRLLGLLALADPPRPGVTEALTACRAAGIRVAMVTGDHPLTAAAIARQVGLLGPEQVVLDGGSLPEDPAVLGALLDRDGVVLSRVTPEQKLLVARALQERGHVVAMTGDGVNDAPALRQADIGVAMGRSGTDVARDAADLVLLDDHFATIVDAVEQGRATYANIRRFLTYHLTDNVAELTPFLVWALSGGRFPLALGVLQILCLDIGTDLLPALALGGERADPRTLDRPPDRSHVIGAAVLRRVFLVLGPAEAALEMSAFLLAMALAGWRPGSEFPAGHSLAAASGAAFAAVVVGQAANSFACRSVTRWPGRLGWRTNPLLLVGLAVSAVLLAVFLAVPAIADVLGQAPPPAWSWTAVAATGAAVLGADALHKRLRRPSPGAAPGDLRP
jgi:magnesium-transporting ATPase (P-type)